MYNYSPIKSLRIKNFRNIGEVEIDFTESPIVTLVGENEAGKTSVIKAFTTCALHANPRDQKDYIRDNTKMFGVEINLQDNTQIVRVKEEGGINLYRVIYPDGHVWDTNKITDGLPEEVSKIMGLIEEPETKEFLHVRTYEDKLLFIVTPNSTNYKVMYNALKVEQITKAIKIGSNEVNTLKSKINNNTISIQTLNTQLRGLSIIDIEPVKIIKDRLVQQLSFLDKIERAKTLKDKVDRCEEQLGALGLLDRFGLQPLNEMLSSNLSNISRLLNNKMELINYSNRLSDINNISEIDTSVTDKLYSIINKSNELRMKMSDAGALVHVSEISEISEVNAVHVSKANTLIDKLTSLKKQLNLIDISGCNEIEQDSINGINNLIKVEQLYSDNDARKNQLEQINTYIEQVQDYMKQCGVAVETCPKCGEAVIFDIDKMGI
jgi:predicted ATP-dependent endonuclease of OLD family